MTGIMRRAVLAVGATVVVASIRRNSLAEEPLRTLKAALQIVDPPRPVPPISIVLPDGTRQGLADYGRRGMVLNMWATWCIPCVAEMSSLDQLAHAVERDHIVVLPLSSDRQGATIVDSFFMTHGIHGLPTVLDPTGAASRLVGVRGIPTTLIINARGFEIGRVEGAVNWADQDTIRSIRTMIGSTA